jgi:hypothetical protein
MGLRHWLEQQRDRVFTLRAARRDNAAVARVVDRVDSAGLHDFGQSKRSLLTQHQGAVARALGRDLLDNPHSHQSDDWRTWQACRRQEHENRLRTGILTAAKSRRHSNSLEQ